MAGNGSRRGAGSGASGAGFRRTGSLPGASRRGAFIVYTDRPDTVADTLVRKWWKLAIVAVGLLVVGIAILVFQMGADDGADTAPVARLEANEPKQVEAFVPPAIAINFLRASTLEEKLKHVRNPDAMTGPITRFHGGDPNRPERYTSIDPVSETAGAPGVQKFYVTSAGDRRLLAIVETAAGPRVDWPAYARLNDMEWSTFQNGARGSPQSFRVHVSDLDYYVGAFADSQKYKSFQISSPELERDIFGYAERGTPTEQALSRFSAPVKQRCILELAPSPSPDARQLVITRLEAKDWIRSE